MTVNSRIPHIDGLRGFAVLLVVIYHFFPHTLKGGFIGVDVFFVISGFVIQKRLSTMNRYSFKEFYTNRVLRIFPALIITVFTVTILGKYFYLDYPLRLLYNSSIASSVFATNYYFIFNSSYFDIGSIAKPLLPLWSLAVEEQFYFFWPLIYWLFSRKFKWILVSALTVSFISACILGINSQNYNFFSLQTRFWEIAAGILAASFRTSAKIVSGTYYRKSILSIFFLIALFAFTANTWPNLVTLFVVLTTLVLILEPGTFFKRFLEYKFPQFFGKISFPLYLLHWPLLSFYSNMRPASIPLFDKLFLLFISILLSYCAYFFVERSIQGIRGGGTKRTWVAGIMLVCLLVSGLLSMELKSQLPTTSAVIRQSISSSNPVVQRNEWYFSGRSYRYQPAIDDNCKYIKEIRMNLVCKYGLNTKTLNAIVVGDSKAEILFRALTRTDNELNWGYLGGALKPIVPLANRKHSNNDSSIRISKWIAIQPSIKSVVIVSATRNLFDLPNDYSLQGMGANRDLPRIENEFDRWIEPLQKTGKQILIIRDNPTLRDPTYCHGIYSAFSVLDRFTQTANKVPGCFYSLSKFNRDSKKYQDLLSHLAMKHPGISIVDNTDFLCNQAKNRCELFRSKRLLYSYTDHMSDFAADYFASHVVASIRSSTL